MTQEELCERAEVSVDAVNRIENGTRVPTLETLEKIAAALGSSVSDLLHVQAPKLVKTAAPVRRLLTLIESEPPEVQEALEEVVRAALRVAKAKRPKRR